MALSIFCSTVLTRLKPRSFFHSPVGRSLRFPILLCVAAAILLYSCKSSSTPEDETNKSANEQAYEPEGSTTVTSADIGREGILSEAVMKEIHSITAPEEFDNIHSEKLYSDDHGTTFLIWVKEAVPMHRHDFHTEFVYVLEGNGTMRVDDKEIQIAPGHLSAIPAGVPHGVETGDETLKVLSIQTPEFNGEDRVMIK